MRSPYFGAVSLHWPHEPGQGWFVNLFVWRCGPLRLSWHLGIVMGRALRGGVELPTHRVPLLHHWLHYVVERTSRSAGAERTRERRGGI